MAFKDVKTVAGAPGESFGTILGYTEEESKEMSNRIIDITSEIGQSDEFNTNEEVIIGVVDALKKEYPDRTDDNFTFLVAFILGAHMYFIKAQNDNNPLMGLMRALQGED